MNFSLFSTTYFSHPLKTITLTASFALIASLSWAQSGILQKRISVQLNDVVLAEALEQIEEKAGCTFIYSLNLLDADRKVSLNYQNETLEQILQDLFGDAVRRMEIKGTRINLQPSAGKGTVHGTVQTSDGQPAGFVTVGIRGQFSTQADEQGRFTLENIEAGTHTITASYVGLQTQQQRVTVVAGSTANVAFTLNEDAQTLQEVVVNGERVNRFANKETEYVARMPLGDLENPQVYTVVHRDLLDEQLVTDYNSILKNVPGVNILWQNAGGNATFSTRGFSISTGLLVNGLSGYTNSDIDPVNIEAVEAIKGPSGTLFGSSLVSYGGLFNRVTKKPVDHFSGELTYTGGSFGLSRFTGDINIPLNEQKTALFRITAAIHNENTYKDAGFRKSQFIAPSFSYQANDRLSFLIQAELYYRKGTSPFTLFPAPEYGTPTPQSLGVDFHQSFLSNAVVMNSPSNTFYGLATYRLSDNWVSQSSFSASSSTNDGLWLYMMATGEGSFYNRYLQFYDHSNTSTYDIQQNFTGNLKTGSVRHRVLVGLDFYSFIDNPTNSSITFDQIDIRNPDPDQYNSLTSPKMMAKLTEAVPFNNAENRQQVYSAYISDVINFTDNLIGMASVRLDRFDNRGSLSRVTGELTGKYAQTALSPKFGLVYQFVKDKAGLFANYLNGFQNVSGTSYDNEPFTAQHANQWEGGVKLNMLGNKLNATISYYDISVEGMLITDPEHPNFSIQAGTQYSKGAEAEVILNPVSGLNIVAGYAYNKSKFTNYDPTLDMLRPVSAGPEHLANWWISYRQAKGKLRGAGLGFGGNYGGEQKPVNNGSGAFILPAFVSLNATAFYDRPAYRIAFKVNNLNNEVYYNGWATVDQQPPRSFLASFTLKL